MSNNTLVKTILILAANPASTARLRLDAEVRSIESALQHATKDTQFRLVQKGAVRLRDFYLAILEHQPQIVHFCGHGTGGNGIVLEDDTGQATLVGEDTLSQLFKLFAVKGVECVVLNACYSEVQAQAISQYIHYVVGMNQTIGDEAALAFAMGFYDALSAGETVEFAFNLARTQLIRLKEDQIPVLKTTPIHPADIQFEAGDIPPNPYLGLSAFGEKDAAFFFGRDKFTDELFRMSNTQPMVAVIGASGSGKSSVVFAGLVPKLRVEGIWLIESFRPKSQPFDELAQALVRQLEPNLDSTEKVIKVGKLAVSLKNGEVKLHQIASQILENKFNKRFLLVVDQFEELYTQCQDKEEQQHFIDALLLAVQQRSLTLVFTLRADFYGYVLSYRPFSEALQQFLHKPLGLMSREELQKAIEQPTQKLNVQLQTHLPQRILEDVGDEPGNLPLLEFALTQLWDNQKDGELTHKAYDDIGGVKQALVKHAEQVYSRLSESQQQQAQRVFLALVGLGEATEDTRRVATKEDIGKQNWDLVTYLAGSEVRLVVTGRNEKSDEETVEVVHEALIREWKRLQEWIENNREKLVQQRRIEARAIEWREQVKSNDYLLEGKQLNEAKIFQKEQVALFPLSSLASEFIQKSIRVRRSKLLKINALAVVPILVIFVSVIPAFRTQSEENALQTLKDVKNPGLREALETLTKGCRTQQQLNWIPKPLVTFSFSSCANIDGINLAGANLSKVDLRYASFSFADLNRADLGNANLSNASFIATNLSNADLDFADLSHARLYDANLSSTQLANTKLSHTELVHANLSHAYLLNADLSHADLEHANLSNTNLSGADLSNTNLFRANLLGAKHSKTYFKNSVYNNETKLPKNFDPNKEGMHLIAPNINLNGVDLHSTNLGFSNLSHANLSSTNLSSTELGLADLSHANLSRANLSRANLITTNLSNAVLSDANFKDASFGCVTSGRTETVCTNFTNAKNLTPEQVKQAKNWQQATYDPKFREQLGLSPEPAKDNSSLKNP